MRKTNFVLLSLPVVICIIVFLLPSYLQEPLVLKFGSLTLWNWFTYIFVHENVKHITYNMIGYLLSISFSYCLLEKKHGDFFAKSNLMLILISTLVIFIFTVITMEAGIFPSNLSNHRGFSGVTSATIGVFGYILARRIQLKVHEEKKLIISLDWFYFILVPIIIVMAYNLSLKLFLAGFILWILVILKIIIRTRKDPKRKLKSVLEKKEIFVIGLSLIVLLLASASLIPVNIVNNGSATNTFAHFIGLLVGFMYSFILFHYKDKKTKP